MYDLETLIDKINIQFDNGLKISEDSQSIIAEKANLVRLMEVLRDDFRYFMLIDITAVDFTDYFELIYHVMDFDGNLLRVKVKLETKESIPSLTSVWKAADAMEREVFDLMGILFTGHSNLKRILCKDDFEGHPLRKDFKLDIVSRF
jgi:NADH-quinone oxidoreductase subunit C